MNELVQVLPTYGETDGPFKSRNEVTTVRQTQLHPIYGLLGPHQLQFFGISDPIMTEK